MDTTRPSKSEDPDRRNDARRGAGAADRGTPERETPEGARRVEVPEAEAPVASRPGPWDHEAESFGAWLGRHRRVRGIELREIAEDSKIGMTYLQAFEDDRFDILPAEVFAKGFLRQYANYVGLDPEEVVNFYLSAARQRQERSEESFDPPAERRRTDPLKIAGLAIGLVLALVVLIWFLFSGAGEPGDETPPAQTGERRQPAVPAAALLPAAAARLPSNPQPPEPEPPERDLSPLRLTLDFSGECWVEISVDGDPRIAENKIQGESLVLRAQNAIDLKIGDVGAVEAELNGLPLRFDHVPGTRVRQQRIDLDTAAALDAAVQGQG